MPTKNPFMSRAKLYAEGGEDNFTEGLRNITGPKRIFQARIEPVVINKRIFEKQLQTYSVDNLRGVKREIYQYRPFTKKGQPYGVYFSQENLLQETTWLFYEVQKHFDDQRDPELIYTDLLMVVFWSNLARAYFEHIVESEFFKLNSMNVLKKSFAFCKEDDQAAGLLENLTLAYAFRNLSEIAGNSGIPSGNPFDYQWIARFYLMKKIKELDSVAMDYIGDTRWYDGMEKLVHKFFEDEAKHSYHFFAETGIDFLKSIPVYLEVGDAMPVFETTIKSSPRTLEDVMRETKPENRKFFREILSLVEYSFELSVNLSHDVGLAIEKGENEVLFELFPQTFTHSMVATFTDIVCIPEETLNRLRNNADDALIERLIKAGFEGDSEGRLTLILTHKISWKRWNEVLDILKSIAGFNTRKQ